MYLKISNMKKVLFVFAVLAIASSACGNRNMKQGVVNGAENKIGSSPSAEKAEGATILLTKEVFLSKVWDFNSSPQEWKFKGNKPAIVDFYADWCGPCRIASPILDEISKEYAGKVDVYKIDTQKERELAAVFGIQSIPAFLYIPVNGKPVMTAGIGRSKEETKSMFIENINKYLLVAN